MYKTIDGKLKWVDDLRTKETPDKFCADCGREITGNQYATLKGLKKGDVLYYHSVCFLRGGKK